MSSSSRFRLPRLTIHFREPDKKIGIARGRTRAQGASFTSMRAWHCYYASFRVLRPDSSTLLITIRADCAKRDETGHTGLPPPRGKTRVEWRSGASAGPGLHGASYLRRKKRVGETPCRRGKGAGGVRGRKNMKRNNWNWAWCQRAHTISAKSLLTLRDLPGAVSAFLATFIWHWRKFAKERKTGTYVSYNGILPLVCRCYARSISAVELCNRDF